MHPETRVVHAGQEIDAATGAVAQPIHLSTTFERDADGEYSRGHVYTRDTNPNRLTLENVLAQLEGGAAAAAFSSGSVATMTLLQALRAGDHVLAPDNFYFGIQKIIRELFADWNLEHSFVDMTDIDAVKAGLRPNTRLVLLETPSNPLMKVSDIAAIASLAHEAGALLACDNTIASPLLQQPLLHGADFVIHATTKYLGGHSDVLGGAVIAREEGEMWSRVQMLQRVGGAVASPFDSWLVLRGIQTLALRINAHASNALELATRLETHPVIAAVLYPGLESHPQHAIASKQMSGYGGLLSILVHGDAARAMEVAAKTKLFIRATSFGGTHSLIEHRASVEAPGTLTPQNLLRLSVGIEHVEDLWEDLTQALA